MYGEKVALLKYDGINSKSFKRTSERREYGTITEFFFLALQFLFVGVCGAQDDFNELSEMKKNMEREVAKLPQNHPLYKKAQL